VLQLTTPCSLSMVVPRGSTGRGKPPQAQKTNAPATITKTPARGVRHTQSTNAAASTLTNLVEEARNNNSSTPVGPADPVSTSLFPPPSYAAATTCYDNNNDTQYDESQALLSAPPPLPEVADNGRVVERQLTATSGLGDDFSSSDEDEEKAGDEDECIMNTFDRNYDDIDDDDDDANINDFAADTYDFNQRMHHYMEYSAISHCNVRSVEYCCMTQANTIVYNNQTKGRVELDEEHLREYLKLIRDIPDSYFVNHTVKTGMLGGYVGMRGKKTAAVANGKKAAILPVPFVRKEKKVVAKVRFFHLTFQKFCRVERVHAM